MPKDDWRIYHVFVEQPEDLPRLLGSVLGELKESRSRGDIKRFYYNRYYGPGQGEPHMTVGLWKANESAVSALQSRVTATGQTMAGVRIAPADPDVRDVSGIEMDILKCLAVELAEKVEREMSQQQRNQLYYLLHFTMNQLGHGYQSEAEVYTDLLANAFQGMHQEEAGRQLVEVVQQLHTILAQSRLNPKAETT